jgi:hypothetical protein
MLLQYACTGPADVAQLGTPGFARILASSTRPLTRAALQSEIEQAQRLLKT